MRKFHGWMLALAAAMPLAALTLAQDAPSSQPPAAPAGVEVLARGPVHEAYAEPVAGTPKASPIVPKKPPNPIEELPPDQKPEGNNVVWMPGYWSFDEERKDYLWVSGFWRSPPPGRQWTPGHWKEADSGWQWVPGFWAAAPSAQQAAAQEVTYLPPPPAPAQTAPSTPAPSPDYTYVPGCWVWRDRYVWQPGYWVANRPNWVWVPAHYVWTPCGYVFVDGYWDYSLRDRGLLFAPVYVSASLYSQPGYCYTPTYVVQDECLYGALFVRPGYSGYYFGDYFGPGYRGGYVAWCDYQCGYYRDPLFTYYSWQYRGDPGWAIGIQAGYVSIYNGSVAPPPRTLIQQNTLVQNTIVNNTVINNTTNVVNNTAIRNTQVANKVRSTSMLAPLNEVKTVKLQPVPMAARQAQRQAARQVVQASAVRAHTEARVLAKGPPPTKLTDPPRTAAMNLPRTPSAPLPAGARPAAPAAVHSPAQPVPHAQPAGRVPHPAIAPAGYQPGSVHPAVNRPSPMAHPPQPQQHQAPSPPPQRRPPPPPEHRPAHGHPEH